MVGGDQRGSSYCRLPKKQLAHSGSRWSRGFCPRLAASQTAGNKVSSCLPPRTLPPREPKPSHSTDSFPQPLHTHLSPENSPESPQKEVDKILTPILHLKKPRFSEPYCLLEWHSTVFKCILFAPHNSPARGQLFFTPF